MKDSDPEEMKLSLQRDIFLKTTVPKIIENTKKLGIAIDIVALEKVLAESISIVFYDIR